MEVTMPEMNPNKLLQEPSVPGQREIEQSR